MTLENRCLDVFPGWLRTLGDDARMLSAVLENPECSDGARRRSAAALTYLFKSLDLIPDGLEDLGFVDDAFVFRACVAGVPAEELALDKSGTLSRLSEDAELIREFLGDLYERLERYVSTLQSGSARGRSVDEVLADESKCAELTREARQWAEAYEPPSFGLDEKNLIKLRSFLAAKLPA